MEIKLSHILPKIVALITRKPRTIIRAGENFEWSDKSWVHNTFRVYELIFGRRSGIRAEMTSHPFFNEKGKLVRTEYFCHSWESVFALTETYVRDFFAAKELVPVRIYVPRLITPQGFTFPSNPFLFAIAFDSVSSSDGGIAVTNTYSHTCTGSNLTLTTIASLAQAPTPTATATYNGTSMTQGVLNSLVTNVPAYIFYLASPSTGAHNVVVTASASARNFGGSISMTGTAASPAGATNTANGTSTAPSVAVTTTQTNSWIVNTIWCNDTIAALSPTATGSNQTSRYTLTHVSGGTSNSSSTQVATSTGSYTSSWSLSSSVPWSSTSLEIKELAAAGPTNVKTWDGLALASVKTINGLAIASVKTVNGLN